MRFKPTITAAAMAVFGLSGAASAGTITPDIIWGSGNTNQGFTVTTAGSLELGIRAKVRRGPTGQPNDQIGVGIIQDTNGNYLFDSSLTNATATQSMWNYDWGINSNVNGQGGGLDTYTYTISVDTDPTINEAFTAVYDPLAPFVFDPSAPFAANTNLSTGYYLGTNATGNGAASFISNADIAGGNPGNFSANNVAQNSVQPQWVGGPVGSGQFAVKLSAFSNGTEVASTTIQAIVDGPAVVPLPAGLPLLLAGLGGLGLLSRRKKRLG